MGTAERTKWGISFEVPGAPVGKGRPRAVRAGQGVRMFTPEKTASYESSVAELAQEAMNGNAVMCGPVVVRIGLKFPVPKSWSKARQQMAIAGEIRPVMRPDADNCAKAVLDAMNQVVFRDDAQIVELVVRKSYCARPGVMVFVAEIGA